MSKELTKLDKVRLVLLNTSYEDLEALRRFTSVPALKPYFRHIWQLVLCEILDRDWKPIGGAQCVCGATAEFSDRRGEELWCDLHESCTTPPAP